VVYIPKLVALAPLYTALFCIHLFLDEKDIKTVKLGMDRDFTKKNPKAQAQSGLGFTLAPGPFFLLI
jgi:hypothetical protein